MSNRFYIRISITPFYQAAVHLTRLKTSMIKREPIFLCDLTVSEIEKITELKITPNLTWSRNVFDWLISWHSIRNVSITSSWYQNGKIFILSTTFFQNSAVYDFLSDFPSSIALFFFTFFLSSFCLHLLKFVNQLAHCLPLFPFNSICPVGVLAVFPHYVSRNSNGLFLIVYTIFSVVLRFLKTSSLLICS